MSITMQQFKETAENIKKLDQKKVLMRSNFEESTGELSECFHHIMDAELDGRKHICLTKDTCPELYAKELDSMGFDVTEKEGLYGIGWENS